MSTQSTWERIIDGERRHRGDYPNQWEAHRGLVQAIADEIDAVREPNPQHSPDEDSGNLALEILRLRGLLEQIRQHGNSTGADAQWMQMVAAHGIDRKWPMPEGVPQHTEEGKA